ncbi:hypothetical protein ACPOL_1622 [Acidisarcina polymorpha]|uniref:Uncharacterized protein n=1 Tax=Acidisarcina polymorpha TaxID=2211140 RepID=A0A2Z5FVS5_9BACT|nr:hypothetical protein [Acidisarcina polymorpha]AXC10968.1 hypothetical protein ACPOL_1622 [Acidisarcina polymorpha]
MPRAEAQYPGHTKKDDEKKVVEPRAISVLEWVGEPGKPSSGRIIPITVFVGGEYQDGGLYLAQPAPLAVESDTLYELERAGAPQGTFDVAGGQNIAGAWFGFGQWKPLAPPKPPKKLTPSKVPPKVVQDNDPDRPHFKGGDDGKNAGNTTPPASDPDKPTIHRKPDSGGSDSNASGSSGGSGSGSTTASNDPDKPTLHRRTDSGSGTASAGGGTAPDDPDRPHLKKHSATSDNAASSDDEGGAVTTANEADPDRPKLSRGKPASTEKPLEAAKLSGIPPNVQQMTAVSDATVREPHTFSYQWPSPDQVVKMQAAVEALAIKAVLANGAAPTAQIPAASTTPTPPRITSRSGPRSTLAHQVAPKPPPVMLTDKDFRAYELSYNGGATLVFTAKAEVGPNNAGVTLEKFVTIIAQPDFNGDPQVRFQSVTDKAHLDITPQMRFVDAVDTDGDNRAELIFELRHSADRQFAIYRLHGTRAEQAFATGSLPYLASGGSETKAN